MIISIALGLGLFLGLGNGSLRLFVDKVHFLLDQAFAQTLTSNLALRMTAMSRLPIKQYRLWMFSKSFLRF